jgi:hypothetical protein
MAKIILTSRSETLMSSLSVATKAFAVSMCFSITTPSLLYRLLPSCNVLACDSPRVPFHVFFDTRLR